jgi:hypothetical protein
LRTESRFVTVKMSINPRVKIQEGTSGSQYFKSVAPATASSATTMTQKYQYIQPVRKPAMLPRASLLYS